MPDEITKGLRDFPESFWDVNTWSIEEPEKRTGVRNIDVGDRRYIFGKIFDAGKGAGKRELIASQNGEAPRESDESVAADGLPEDTEPTDSETAYAGAQIRVAIVSLRLLKQNKTVIAERNTLGEAIDTLENHYAKLMRGQM